MNSYSLGIDIAKGKMRFHLADTQGRCHASGSLSTSRAGLQQLQQRLKPLAPPAAITVVLEATGVLHVPWAEALHRDGYPVLSLNPLVAKRLHNADTALRDNKTDKIDAAKLADVGLHHAEKLQRFRYDSDATRFGLQRLHNVRRQIRHHLTNLRKAYGSLLDAVFPELPTLVSIHNRGVCALLALAPTPAALLQQPQAKLRAAFGQQTQAVCTAARDTLATAALSQACAPALQGLLSCIDQCEAQLKSLDKQLQDQTKQLAHPERVTLVRSIRGIGEKTAATVVAFVPEEFWKRQSSRRRTVKRLLAYLGGEPRVQESGKYKGQARMSKRGCEPLRTALFQASVCGRLHDEALETIYQRQRAAKKAHKVAISHVMRRQVIRLVSVMQSGIPMPPTKSRRPTHAKKR